jgi:glucose-6-phosphate isomerase
MNAPTDPGDLASALLAPDPFRGEVRAALGRLDAGRVIARIRARDHTVWRDDPRELVDRLGWLDVATRMRAECARIQDWAAGLAGDGVRDVVLLGMGGSSLAPEVFARTFPADPLRPRLHVLDSTSPAWIRRVTRAVDPRSTHVLVASKSGTTIEVDTLAAHFRALVERAVGGTWSRHFTAITDPGTVLDERSTADRFRAVWRNPPDIGGRFSALSFFGLVPAAAIGVDVGRLLAGAEAMAADCAEERAARNPGALLGAVLATGVAQGRDKLTLAASREVAAFGLWVEQLLAESTGKDGSGVIPVVDEPPDAWAGAGHDRMFVALDLAGSDDPAHRRRVEAIRRAGGPLLELVVPGREGLGGEMYRWEFATAVAGHLLGIHPFDQPDVQSAKTRTGEILATLAAGGTPPSPPAGDAAALLADVSPPEWVSLMVYGDPSPDLQAALSGLRAAIGARGAATTLGLGPRFLHSTGQLHKGGPDTGRFLQLVLDESALPVPGRPTGFGELMRAQADGDGAALRDRGRRLARIEGGADPVRVVRELTAALRARGGTR